MIFNKNDGLRYTLEKRFNDKKTLEFPNDGVDYINLFKQIEEHLNKDVHPETEKGALLHGDGLLTDHGVDHVAMVIQRAGLILGDKIDSLSGFEIFILLLSIHLHDIGNIYGRNKHEENIGNVVKELDIMSKLQTPVLAIIVSIATAHGGEYNFSKDTIISLPLLEYVEGKEVHPTILASILRYADELAEDHTRAAKFLLDANILKGKNKLYHVYSKTLEPIAITGDTVIYNFNIPIEYITNASLLKDESDTNLDIYLYDEILLRLCKSIRELDYCKKYSQGFILLNAVKAKISIFSNKTAFNPLYSEYIRLRLAGYPEPSNFTIDKLCENKLSFKNGYELKEYVLSIGGKG